jgi:hypothetical protein
MGYSYTLVCYKYMMSRLVPAVYVYDIKIILRRADQVAPIKP